MIKSLPLLAISLALFTGCIDGKNPSEPKDTADENTAKTIKGKVVGLGYMTTSTVCLDSNKDFSCAGEVYSTSTDSKGSFSLAFNEASDIEDSQIIAVIASGETKDTMESSTVSYDAVYSHNTGHLFLSSDDTWESLLIHGTEDEYDSNNGQGIIVSGLTHYINIKVQESILLDGFTYGSIVTQDIMRNAISDVASQTQERAPDIFKDLNWLISETSEASAKSLLENTQLKVASYGRSWREYFDHSGLLYNNLGDMVKASESLNNQFSFAIDTLDTGASIYPGLYQRYRELLDSPTNYYAIEDVILADTSANYGLAMSTDGLYQFLDVQAGISSIINRFHGGALGVAIKSAYSDSISTRSLNLTDPLEVLSMPIGLTNNTNMGLITFDTFNQSGETASADFFGQTASLKIFEITQKEFATSVVKESFGLTGVGATNIFGTGDRIFFRSASFPDHLYKVTGTNAGDYDTLTGIYAIYPELDIKEDNSGNLYHKAVHSDLTEYLLTMERVSTPISEAEPTEIGDLNLYNIYFNKSAMDSVLSYLSSSVSAANTAWPSSTDVVDTTNDLVFNKDTYLNTLFP